MVGCNGCNCELENVDNNTLKKVMSNVLCKRKISSSKLALSVELLFYVSTFSMLGYVVNKRLNKENMY
jgi:hypothetical protein